jgi:transcriptional regulator with XRE-family HTH domain
LSTVNFSFVNFKARKRAEIMYDHAVMDTISFRTDRLKLMMEKRNLKPGQLEYLSGVSQPMISLLLKDSRPNVSVIIVAKLAGALGCSVDYLVGLTEDYRPLPMNLTDALDDLVRVARKLPNYRQSDLLEIAKTFQNKNEMDDTRLMNTVLEKINELGGVEAESLILGLLESLRPPADDSGASPTSD